ncbi:hypothetical protein [Paenibacillus sp. GYB003]|uniref:hypothetical protein n=1 Tax=Paenibacillus sp. GYB003 TaxID=2994392 RepID=UPI002F961B3A
MSDSWTAMRKVPQSSLQERLETVKHLAGDDAQTELYEIVKDTRTGDHYLHYAYLHLTVADGSTESFHQLLPLESDDVLAILFGEQPYAYPDHWRRPFLRNGPDGTYVWFDPEENLHGADDEHERLAGEIAGMLGAWKQAGQYDSESAKALLERIEQAMKRKG